MKKIIPVHNYKVAKEALSRRTSKETLINSPLKIGDRVIVTFQLWSVDRCPIKEPAVIIDVKEEMVGSRKERYYKVRLDNPDYRNSDNIYERAIESIWHYENNVSLITSAHEALTRRPAKESASKAPAVFIDASGSMYFSLSKTIATAKRKFGDKAKYFTFNDDVSEVDINSLSNDNLGGGTNFSKLEKFINDNKSRFSTITIYTDSGVELKHYNFANATIIDVDSLTDSASESQARRVAKES